MDLERRRPVDVLPGRDAEPLAAWLKDDPEEEIICRDRAGAYAEGRPQRCSAGPASKSPMPGTCGTTSARPWERPSPAPSFSEQRGTSLLS
ncbi:hypothetical protein ACFV19_33105 [Streptomyces griseoluteus]|uniref:hypothetical protein n=1 Tax=Streptomyces griseoluteus TaxID=29306 RepID=UPI0036ACC8E7